MRLSISPAVLGGSELTVANHVQVQANAGVVMAVERNPWANLFGVLECAQSVKAPDGAVPVMGRAGAQPNSVRSGSSGRKMPGKLNDSSYKCSTT